MKTILLITATLALAGCSLEGEQAHRSFGSNLPCSTVMEDYTDQYSTPESRFFFHDLTAGEVWILDFPTRRLHVALYSTSSSGDCDVSEITYLGTGR